MRTSCLTRNIIHAATCAGFILLVTMVTGFVDGKCPPGKFGSYCRLTCNCRGSSDCDVVTGKCAGPCADGWSGPSCQRQNVVLGMPTDMKTSDWSKGARAVDGDARTCVTSSSNRTGWWRVDMLVQRTVFHMQILFANETIRPGKIHVHVSDYMDTFWGKPCTRIPTSHRKSHFSCDLPTTGRYFGVINKQGQITLCEVSVFECSPLTFGEDCSHECLCKDVTEVCHPVTGMCHSGCRAGYTGSSCRRPCLGRYGRACRHSCGYCYDNETCNHVTGMCERGCAEGWTGSECKKRCEPGLFGLNCSHRCQHCLDNATCHFVTGNCPWRCEPGWKGLRCDTECEPGQHGQSCQFRCGNCHGGTACNRHTGICPFGCSLGFHGLFCTSECLSGRWGPNCWYMCGHCLNHDCDKMTGHCGLPGCQLGWSGPRCDIQCKPGNYGANCNLVCGHCQSACHVMDGTCTTRCTSGWRGQLCADTCTNRTFGEGCVTKCGYCANNDVCHHANGYCPHGCQAGYSKPLCIIRTGTLLGQLGRPNLLTFLIGCMAVGCSIIVGVFLCFIIKCHRENNKDEISVDTRQTYFKQTVV